MTIEQKLYLKEQLTNLLSKDIEYDLDVIVKSIDEAFNKKQLTESLGINLFNNKKATKVIINTLNKYFNQVRNSKMNDIQKNLINDVSNVDYWFFDFIPTMLTIIDNKINQTVDNDENQYKLKLLSFYFNEANKPEKSIDYRKVMLYAGFRLFINNINILWI